MSSLDTEKEDLLVLGIETSCDETAASVVKGCREILSNVIYSQIDLHTVYGGVVPEIASRGHIEKIDQVVKKALSDAGKELKDLDAIAVTYGPGLVGALLVGLSCAKGLAEVSGKPLVGVNHLKGHIAANYICFEELEPPFLCLCVSGGNSMIVRVDGYTEMTVLGRTRDDAAGEAIDKIARVVGLGYPGGPKMDKAGQGGDTTKYVFSKTHMGDTLDFSFSGLKTSALNLINGLRQKGEEIDLKDFTASYQQAIADALLKNTMTAIEQTGIKKLCLAGGVSANSFLRNTFEKQAKKKGIKLYYPDLKYCTDNAAMIASCGYYEYMNGKRDTLDLNAYPSLQM